MSIIVGYARVSTVDQKLDLQTDALARAGCTCIETEKASGTRDDRPVLAKLLAELSEGDTLVVWRLDRLGRSMAHLVNTVTALQKRGVGFRSISDSLDTTTASGTLVFGIFAALAQFERSLIVERTAAGLAAARKRGKFGGRVHKLNGEQRKMLLACAAEGKSKPEIGRLFGLDRTSVYRYLKEAEA